MPNNEEDPVNEGVIFSNMAVVNSLLNKLPQKKQEPKGTPIDNLNKRLNLLKY